MMKAGPSPKQVFQSFWYLFPISNGRRVLGMGDVIRIRRTDHNFILIHLLTQEKDSTIV